MLEVGLDAHEFVGKVALVTGAASGIGEAVTQILRDRGATVAACDQNFDDNRGDEYRMDVTDTTVVQETINTIEERHGGIDIVVNAAGILTPKSLGNTSYDEFVRVLSVNTLGVFNVTQSATNRMKQRGQGCVVTIASNAGGIPRQGIGAYATSKAASAHLTKCFGLELAEFGIRCNVVSPGSTDTPMLRALWGDNLQGAIDGDPNAFRLGIPLRSVAAPHDIAETVLFLASDRASHLTMQELFVDGGASLR